MKSGPAVNAFQIPAPDPAMMREKRKQLVTELAVVVVLSIQKAKGPKIKNALARHRKSRINLRERCADVVVSRSSLMQKRRYAFCESGDVSMPLLCRIKGVFSRENRPYPIRKGGKYLGGRSHWVAISSDCWWLSHGGRVLLVSIPTETAIANADTALGCEHAGQW